MLINVCVYLSVVVVTKMNDPVTLTCRTNTEGAVEWKFDDDVVGVGLNLSISGVEAPDLGEYTCWRGKEMLSSTYLLPDSVEEVPSEMLWFHFPFIQLFMYYKCQTVSQIEELILQTCIQNI